MMRAWMSEPPPAAEGTMNPTSRSGVQVAFGAAVGAAGAVVGAAAGAAAVVGAAAAGAAALVGSAAGLAGAVVGAAGAAELHAASRVIAMTRMGNAKSLLLTWLSPSCVVPNRWSQRLWRVPVPAIWHTVA